MKASWVKVRTGRDHSATTGMGKTDSTWVKLIYYQSERDNEKLKLNLKTPSPHPSPLPGLIFIPSFLYLLTQGSAGGRGMGVEVSSSHIGSAAPSSSHSAPAPAWAASHGRPFSMNLFSVSSSHGLQLFTNCPSMGPSHGVQSFRNRLLQLGSPRGDKPCQQTCSGVGSSLHMSAGLRRSLLQRRLPTGSQLPSRIPLLRRGFLHGLQVETCSTMDLLGLQHHSLPHHGNLWNQVYFSSQI